ncbi:hypothetical protein ACGFI9_01515 [Micromonospora sp. NPDC048930]|uniref:hypothetical protein n=1 Tax=Micromonospora sp. NPDC048930 TaxID=3364261 RepID=UPI003710496D
MTNARPGAGSGTGATTAGEHVPDSVTDLTDKPQRAVPGWLWRRGGDPVNARRRIAAQLDDLLGVDRRREPVPYAAGGMTLDLAAREAAA